MFWWPHLTWNFHLVQHKDRRAELSLEDAPEDRLLEELLPNRFIMSAYNFLKIKFWSDIDSNYSYRYIEAIASIQTT